MRKKSYIFYQLLSGLFLFELLSIIFFNQIIRSLYPRYLKLNSRIDHGLLIPRYYLGSNKKKGFDISPNFKKTISLWTPPESKGFDIWSNSLGCYDIPIPKKRYDIYLAGDSMTWGYTNFNNKFGTILENSLKNKKIAKCGVFNTGQKHQFYKFKEISKKLGYYPNSVIVNIYRNDIRDDFLFPDSTIYKGYLVKEKRFEYDKDNEIRLINISKKEIEEKYIKWEGKNKSNLRKIDPRVFSSSAILVAELIKKIKFINHDEIKSEINPKLIETSFYNYESKNKYSKNHMEIIKKWINHSKKNNYELIFSTISSKNGDFDAYDKFHNFVSQNNGISISFDDYIKEKNISRKSLFWRADGHLNARGNRTYAEFLKSKL